MAVNVSKFKASPKPKAAGAPPPPSKRKGLGIPPPIEEASPNLAAPELHHGAAPAARIDGRSLRRSSRTLQFATRVTPEFDARIRAIATRDGLMLVEILERALDAYDAERAARSKPTAKRSTADS